ncbi:MAG: enolase C-terminal domain-like protein [Conexibacter sp.]
MNDRIAAADAWIVRFELERPILLGHWTIPHREYAVLQLRTEDGRTAAAYALTRDNPVAPALDARAAAALGRTAGELLDGAETPPPDPLQARAAALVDACAWDLAAQAAGVPLWQLLADGDSPADPPAAMGVAVCGYPVADDLDAAGVAAEAAAAIADGYVNFKIPGLGSIEDVDERLAAICALDERAEVIVDLEAAQTGVAPVLERARAWQRHRLLWLEDPYRPPGAAMVPELVEGSPVTIAIGDEWSEPDIRDLLAQPGPRARLRLDFSTLGGLSVSRRIAREVGAPVAQHIYPELQRHLVHAGLAVPQLDVYREDPAIDFADRMLGPTAFKGGRVEAPREPGPCMQLDHELIAAHATWQSRR